MAAVLAVPLASLLGGWRGSLAALALLPTLAAISWWTLIRHIPAADTSAEPEAPAVPAPSVSVRLRLAGVLACMSWAYYGVVAWMPADLIDAGWSEAGAGVALGLLAAASIASTIIFGGFGDRVGTRTGWIAAALGCMLLGLVGVIVAPGLGLLWAVIFGVGNGSSFGAAMTLPLDLVENSSLVAA
jgi:CP family cyanate transporter-like MFS transporter